MSIFKLGFLIWFKLFFFHSQHYCFPSDSCLPSWKHCEDGCPSHLQLCEQVLLQGMLCSSTDSICPALAYSPSNFSDFLSSLSKHSYNCSFCPLNAGCIDHGQPCNLTAEYSGQRNTSQTPWGTNCSSSDHYFCPLLVMCVHSNISCSYDALHRWILSGDLTIGPYGTVCGVDEKYCFANQSCISVNNTCEVMLPQNGSLDETCSKGQQFCPLLIKCVNKNSYNTTCAPLSPLTFSTNSDNETGKDWNLGL